jgi:hypothetical protein
MPQCIGSFLLPAREALYPAGKALRWKRRRYPGIFVVAQELALMKQLRYKAVEQKTLSSP